MLHQSLELPQTSDEKSCVMGNLPPISRAESIHPNLGSSTFLAKDGMRSPQSWDEKMQCYLQPKFVTRWRILATVDFVDLLSICNNRLN